MILTANFTQYANRSISHRSNVFSYFQAKLKAEKNRQKVQEEYLKSTHAQRQEAAQQRREEKRRVEKERILSEDDPEKQRKWEVSQPDR